MTAAQLLTDLRAKGVQVVAVGEKLHVRPIDQIGPETREALLAHKREILALLTGNPSVSEIARRADAFREQLKRWTASKRVGVPILALSDVEPGDGDRRCISCGERLSPGRSWRCDVCVVAVNRVLAGD